ncbi:uncharacterized protein [Lepisosteus oculatus]|uniref:uncharacterized protein isoform X1 n=1 Tax=Lepisosteus oculatus TaxID=7918 RepID=UPI0035F50F26
MSITTVLTTYVAELCFISSSFAFMMVPYRPLLLVWNILSFFYANSSEETLIFGKLGESVALPFGSEIREYSDVKLTKGNSFVFKHKNEKSSFGSSYKNRTTFNENGTIVLERTVIGDAGEYKLQAYKKGKLVYNASVHLIIQCVTELPFVYGDLGFSVTLFDGNVDFQNISNAKWKKGDTLVAQFVHSHPQYNGEFQHGTEVFQNGTLKMQHAEENDAGNYTLEVSNGDILHKWTTQLFVIVHRPVIEHTCIPGGEAEFRCSVKSNADPFIEWTLNGSPLENRSGNQTVVLGHFHGQLVCAVKHYSSISQSDSVSFPCVDQKWGLLLFVPIGISLLIIFSLAGYCLAKKCPCRQQDLFFPNNAQTRLYEEQKMEDCIQHCQEGKIEDCTQNCQEGEMEDCTQNCQEGEMEDCTQNCQESEMEDCTQNCQEGEMEDFPSPPPEAECEVFSTTQFLSTFTK